MSKMIKVEMREKKSILPIDIFAGLGRKIYVNKRAGFEIPSLFSSFEDERTQKYINASFLPFFALLSIPPSFN